MGVGLGTIPVMGRDKGLSLGERLGSDASIGRAAARRQMESMQRQASAQQVQAQQMTTLIQQNQRIIELLEYLAKRSFEDAEERKKGSD